jgi:hypothetical protein
MKIAILTLIQTDLKTKVVKKTMKVVKMMRMMVKSGMMKRI